MASDVVSRMELTGTDYSFMCSFVKIEEKWLSSLDKELKRRVHSKIDYYKHVKSSPTRTEIYKLSDGIVPRGDNFYLNKTSYLTNEFKIQYNLEAMLMKALVTKMMGQNNARYDNKVQNFFLDLVASGYNQAYEYVSKNLG